MTAPSRSIWQLIEPIHAVTYFAPSSLDRIAELGTKGFWMGYFATRSAPLGAANPAVVEATFYNFSPRLVYRALPDAWSYTTPEAAIDARAEGSALALRESVPDIDETVVRVVPLLEAAARGARCGGRPLSAANQSLAQRDDPVERLWQACTTLREHRGDGHVAALVAAGIGGIDAHLLGIAAGHVGAAVKEARGWSEDEWQAARDAIAGGDADALAVAYERVEQITDELALQPYRDGLTDDDLELLTTLLGQIARPLVASGVIPFPNPIGLTPPA